MCTNFQCGICNVVLGHLMESHLVKLLKGVTTHFTCVPFSVAQVHMPKHIYAIEICIINFFKLTYYSNCIPLWRQWIIINHMAYLMLYIKCIFLTTQNLEHAIWKCQWWLTCASSHATCSSLLYNILILVLTRGPWTFMLCWYDGLSYKV